MGRSLEAAAHCPGHITGFFTIEDESPDLAARGSRGAGFSVELGVTSRARVETGAPEASVTVKRADDDDADAETTARAVAMLIDDRPWRVRIDQRESLPVGQGFGISGAAALSASLAVASAAGLDAAAALSAAHRAEVERATGLGDVVGAHRGGFELRTRAGVPPAGRLESFATDSGPRDVTLLVAGPRISTSSVVADATRSRAINAAGNAAIDAFTPRPSLEAFGLLSRAFAQAADLTPAPVAALLDALGAHRVAAQCMLGSSVFVMDHESRIRSLLPHDVQAISTRVSISGARVLDAPVQ